MDETRHAAVPAGVHHFLGAGDVGVVEILRAAPWRGQSRAVHHGSRATANPTHFRRSLGGAMGERRKGHGRADARHDPVGSFAVAPGEHDLMPGHGQALDDMASKKAGSTSNDDPHQYSRTIPPMVTPAQEPRSSTESPRRMRPDFTPKSSADGSEAEI